MKAYENLKLKNAGSYSSTIVCSQDCLVSQSLAIHTLALLILLKYVVMLLVSTLILLAPYTFFTQHPPNTIMNFPSRSVLNVSFLVT